MVFECSSIVVLAILTTFLGCASLWLALFIILRYGAMYEGKAFLSTQARSLLTAMAIIGIAATITVAIVLSNMSTSSPSTSPSPSLSAASRSSPLALLQTPTVNGHNAKRLGPLNPPAASMPALKWDHASGDVAQTYIDKCPGLVHNANRGARGENIYVSSASIPPETAITNAVSAWFNEAQYYNYAANSCATGKMCGHYTQVVWANTWGVGCGVRNNCPGPWVTQVVCNYVGPGNYVGQRPYVQGSAPTTTTKATSTPSPTDTYTHYGGSYELISWTPNADGNTEMSGLARRTTSNSKYITYAKLPSFARGQIFATASSTPRTGGQGWDEVRVVGRRAYIQQPATTTTPTWVSLSGLSYVPALAGFTNLALKAPVAVYSTSWNQPSFRVSGNRAQTRGLTRSLNKLTGSAAITVATNLPAHSIRDIFVCKSSNGPSRCDVVGRSIIAYPTMGGTWPKVGWLSLDGLQSFPTTAGFSNLALRGTAKRYSTGYAAPSAAIIGGTVYLRGLINMKTSTDKVVAVLPASMRPRKRHIFLQMCSRSGGQLCRVDVFPTGAVQLVNGGVHNWLSLAGIHFVRTPTVVGP